MRAEVERDLSDSAYDFLRVVWPAVAESCNGGRFIPVEATGNQGLVADFDVLAGIDAWQMLDDRGAMRGIASRVQWGDHAWDTFTIRKSRFNGSVTEFGKRLFALDHPAKGYLRPHLFIQAYVSERRTGRLLSAATCLSDELIRCCADGKADVRPTDNADFFYVDWATYGRLGNAVRVVRPAFRASA